MTALASVSVSPNGGQLRAIPLGDRVSQLKAIVEELYVEYGGDATGPEFPALPPQPESEPVPEEPARCPLALAKALVACRRRRDKALGKELFSDPAWDILLDLFVAQSENRDVAIGSACIAAAVPFSSARRWCQLLEKRELLYRTRDPRDGRRVFLRLTGDAFDHVRTALLQTGGAR